MDYDTRTMGTLAAATLWTYELVYMTLTTIRDLLRLRPGLFSMTEYSRGHPVYNQAAHLHVQHATPRR